LASWGPTTRNRIHRPLLVCVSVYLEIGFFICKLFNLCSFRHLTYLLRWLWVRACCVCVLGCAGRLPSFLWDGESLCQENVFLKSRLRAGCELRGWYGLRVGRLWWGSFLRVCLKESSIITL
jgi:hypothetical protein